MRASNILKVVCVAVVLYHSLAVPIGRVIGCGKEDPDLSPEMRKYCCESFSLDCEESETVSLHLEAQSVTESPAKQDSIYERLIPRRQLGGRCKEPIFSCGVGLECHMGICRRVRTRAHLKAILERGKEVKREERMDIEEDGATESPKQNEQEGQLTLHGQSVSVEDTVASASMRGKNLLTGKGERYSDSAVHRKSAEARHDTSATDFMFEEDEVAANVADLLATELHVTLNASQVRSIRDVIAGTLDERAEREDDDAPTGSTDGAPPGHVQSAGNRTCAAQKVEI